MKILSLYCGAGGMDEGIKQTGLKTTLAIDIWDKATDSFKINHPDTEVLTGKVSDYYTSFGEFDMVIGGPPCPEFSRAKINRSFNSCQVDLFWDIVKQVKAKFWIMENVQDVIEVVKDKKNYLINACYYGVPQNRLRRIFTNIPFPKYTHSEYPSLDLFGNQIKPLVSVKDVLGLDGFIEDRSTTFGETEFRLYPTTGLSNTIIARCRQFIKNDKENRELTPDELKLLQGFPKDYVFTGSKTNQFKQIGNAVPPPVIKAFGDMLKVTLYE